MILVESAFTDSISFILPVTSCLLAPSVSDFVKLSFDASDGRVSCHILFVSGAVTHYKMGLSSTTEWSLAPPSPGGQRVNLQFRVNCMFALAPLVFALQRSPAVARAASSTG